MAKSSSFVVFVYPRKRKSKALCFVFFAPNNRFPFSQTALTSLLSLLWSATNQLKRDGKASEVSGPNGLSFFLLKLLSLPRSFVVLAWERTERQKSSVGGEERTYCFFGCDIL